MSTSWISFCSAGGYSLYKGAKLGFSTLYDLSKTDIDTDLFWSELMCKMSSFEIKVENCKFIEFSFLS